MTWDAPEPPATPQKRPGWGQQWKALPRSQKWLIGGGAVVVLIVIAAIAGGDNDTDDGDDAAPAPVESPASTTAPPTTAGPADTTAPTPPTTSEPAEGGLPAGDNVPWDNYDPSVRTRIVELATAGDCGGLQSEFDNADANDDNQRSRVGEGNAELMSYLDELMSEIGCYG